MWEDNGMAKIDIPEIVEAFDRDFREALAEAVESTVKDAQFDPKKLYSNFIERIKRRFLHPREVDDKYVDGGKEK